MFPDDMTEQRKKLMGTLAVVVGSLHDLGAVLPAASALAKKHVGYGVTAAQYPIVGAALLWTLEQGLGDAWNPEVSRSVDRGLRHAVGLHDQRSLRVRRLRSNDPQ